MINSRRTRWAERVVSMGKMRNSYKILVGKPEGRRPLKRQRPRWVSNITMDLEKNRVCGCGVDLSVSG
jgi:hypothetical protein